MIRLGIVGAKSTHSLAFAQAINIRKECGRAKVEMLWGETRQAARKVSDQGNIPHTVRAPEEMIGHIDAVIIAHRAPEDHAPVARYFIEAGVPAFVDKPFTATVREGKKLWKLAKERGVPLTSFSVLPEQESIRKELKRKVQRVGKLRIIESSGPGDIRSKWGGPFFYGIHQAEVLTKMFQADPISVQVTQSPGKPRDAIITMKGRSGSPLATIVMLTSVQTGFHFRATGEKGTIDHPFQFDRDPYLAGIRKVIRMFRTGNAPYGQRETLRPVAVLEAVRKSLEKNGAAVRVART